MERIKVMLGASDPEMQKIKEVLSAVSGVLFVLEQAMKGGRPVHAGNALSADPIDTSGFTLVWFVECRAPMLHDVPAIRIDHHNPGDVGYDALPEDYFAGSSLGQVIVLLAERGWLPKSWELFPCQNPSTLVVPLSSTFVCSGSDIVEVPYELLMVAAADHCLGAAYNGECPCINPELLLQYRAKSKAAFQTRRVDDVLQDIYDSIRALNSGTKLPGTEFVDMRREPPWPELVEAGTFAGISYVSGPLLTPDGRKKFTASGTEGEIAEFMRDNPLGLVGLYGNPHRRFAGGYKD